MRVLRVRVIPDDPATQAVLRFFSVVVVPFGVMYLALHRALSTAATPFEEFVGVSVAVGLGVLWTIFAALLTGVAQTPNQALQQTGPPRAAAPLLS